jgi:hypothetical protein
MESPADGAQTIHLVESHQFQSSGTDNLLEAMSVEPSHMPGRLVGRPVQVGAGGHLDQHVATRLDMVGHRGEELLGLTARCKPSKTRAEETSAADDSSSAADITSTFSMWPKRRRSDST